MNKNVLIIGLLVLAIAGVVILKKSKNSIEDKTAASPTLLTSHSNPTHTTSSDESAVQKPAMLELGSVSCVPCKMMEPVLEQLRATFGDALEVEFIDIWKNQEVGQQYGIRAIPTQIFFDANGNEIFRHQGFFPYEDIVAKWKELGYDFSAQK